MCSSQTSLQILVGDGLLRIPLFHFTAKGKGKTTQKQESPLDAPRPESTPSHICSPLSEWETLPFASSGLRLPEAG